MLSYFELRKGVKFILNGEPYEVLEFQQVGKAQDVFVAQTKIKNLINGKILEKSFHQSDVFEETELNKIEIKFLYSHRDKFFFSETDDHSKRFEITKEQIGSAAKFLKPNQILTGVKFEGKIVNITLPIKVQLKVVESPPGIKGNRAQSGTKLATLETGVIINVPLFVEVGETIEINTETGEYVRRIE